MGQFWARTVKQQRQEGTFGQQEEGSLWFKLKGKGKWVPQCGKQPYSREKRWDTYCA